MECGHYTYDWSFDISLYRRFIIFYKEYYNISISCMDLDIFLLQYSNKTYLSQMLINVHFGFLINGTFKTTNVRQIFFFLFYLVCFSSISYTVKAVEL